MCRARPGPRCSSEGRKRHSKAVNHFQVVKERYDAANERGRVPRRLQAQMSKASLRLNAAQIVFWTTPDGHIALKSRIEQIRNIIARRYGENEPERSDVQEYAAYRSLNSSVERLERRLQEGVSRRENSYEDLRMVKDERAVLRRQATARGGHIGPNAHPLSPTNAAALREGLAARGVTLREWGPDDVARAHTWVEHGANPNYVDNDSVRPVSTVRGEDGRLVHVGQKVEGEIPQSKLIRVNSPDGSAIEGRHDFVLTKNDDDKYVVTLRSRVATSWEDSSPIDITKMEVGHLLTNREVGHAESKMLVGSFGSKTEAKRALRDAKRNFDAPKVTALMGRDILTKRAGRRSTSLQRRGLQVWFRYQNPEFQNEA